VIIFDKICGATAVRQKAVEDLAVKVELMIVVGDTKSSNTKKLYEISKKLNDNTYLIENEEQLDLDIFSDKKVVGITAGASTPEETIMNIEKKIRGIYKMSNVNENQNEFSQMLEEFLPNQEKRVEGVIESMDQNFSYLDVPGERTAVRVRTDELKGYKVGDTVEVLITGLSEEDDDQEYITASRKKIEVEKNWEKIEDSFKNKTILDAEVTKKIKGGYLVQALLYPGFLPNSLSEIPDNEEKVVGKKIQVIVKDIKVDPKDKRNKKITYSVKDIKIAEQEKEFAALEVGQIVDCVVTEVLDFGLAVDINTLKGFIHISEVSWKRLDKLSDIYKVGDHIKAVIVSLDEAKRNVKLSIKKLEEDFNLKERKIEFHTYADIIDLGKSARIEGKFKPEEYAENVDTDDLASIIFTSGTTGNPKGVTMSHRNFMTQLIELPDRIILKPGQKAISVLPVWHSFERACEYVIIISGGTIAYSKPIGSVLLADMLKINPTLFPSVPRIWEAVYDGIFKAMKKRGRPLYYLFLFFIEVGVKTMRLKRRVTGRWRTISPAAAKVRDI